MMRNQPQLINSVHVFSNSVLYTGQANRLRDAAIRIS